MDDIPAPIWSISGTTSGTYRRCLRLTKGLRQAESKTPRRWVVYCTSEVGEELAREIAWECEGEVKRVNPPHVVEALVKQWSGLIVHTIKRLEIWPHVDRDGLESEIWYTLHKCASGYDSTKGWQFDTYAITAIKRSVVWRWMQREKYRCERSTAFGEVEEETWEVHWQRQEEPGKEDEQPEPWGTFTGDIADRGLTWLSKHKGGRRMVQVLQWRFKGGLTLEQIAGKIRLSKERVRQIQAGGIMMLREWAKRRGFEARYREGER